MSNPAPLTIVLDEGKSDFNLNFVRERTFVLRVNVITYTGVAVDLTGYVVRLRAKVKPFYDYAIDIVNGDDETPTEIVVTPLTGNIVVTIPPASMTSWAFDTAEYELTATLGSNSYVLLDGHSTLNEAIGD